MPEVHDGPPKFSDAMTLKNLTTFIPIILLPLALWLGYRAFGDHSLAEIQDLVTSIPTGNVLLAFGFTALSYLTLTGFDWAAVRYAGQRLAYPKIALTSFVSLSIGHNVGVAALSSGAMRYRFYAHWGIGAADVARIIVFCGLTVAVGLMTLGGSALLFGPDVELGAVGLSPGMARAIGVACLVLVTVYLVLAWRLRRPLELRGHAIELPTLRLALIQLALGTVNFAFVAAALHQLMAAAASYPETVTAYVVGNVAGIVSHVPGGLGVLEYVISSLVGDGRAIGALIAFRIVYFFVPLLLGGLLLALAELRRWRTG